MSIVPALQVNQLTKSYGNNRVVKDVSFEVKQGEIFGLLGTNGAGKTTTLECIEGIRKYDNGTIILNGQIGVQLQSSSLPSRITAMEAIHWFSKWNKTAVNQHILHNLGIEEFKNNKYKELSTGQKRRLHLVLSLIGNPDIVILDEPTAGLDVEGRLSLHHEIRRLRAEGTTILLTSHDMAEVESLCDRIAILKGGQIVFIGTPHDLALRIDESSTVLIQTSPSFDHQHIESGHFKGMKQQYSVYSVENIGDALLELITVAKQQHKLILDIKIERDTLEQSFLHIAKEAE